MSSELGVGKRVRLGWAPDSLCTTDEGRNARLQPGYIVDGPIPPGAYHRVRSKRWVKNSKNFNFWRVLTDQNNDVIVGEPYIFPEDGDPDQISSEKEYDRTTTL